MKIGSNAREYCEQIGSLKFIVIASRKFQKFQNKFF